MLRLTRLARFPLAFGRALRLRFAFRFFACLDLCFFAVACLDLFTTGLEAGAALPDPEKVALAGAPKSAGCGEGAARQESAVVHGGEDAVTAGQRAPAEQTCASYTSYALSRSWLAR